MSVRGLSHRPAVLRSAQAGIAGLVALMFIIIVALFAMAQAAAITSSNISDSQRQLDSVEALFLAESAIERVGVIYVTDKVCTDIALGVGDPPVTLGRGVFRVLGAFNTNFTGGTIMTGMCRVRVQGEITGSKVKRTLETIVGEVDDLISLASLNPDFNATPYTGARSTDEAIDVPPDVWQMPCPMTASVCDYGSSIPYRRWDKSGGPDGSRSAFVRKTATGSDTQTIGGAFTLADGVIQITAPKILRLTFDYQVWYGAGGGGGAGNAAKVMYVNPYLVFGSPTNTPYYAPNGAGCGSFAFCSVRTVNKPSGTMVSPSLAPFALPVNNCGFKDTAGYESGTGGPNYNASCTDPPTGNTYWKTDGSLYFDVNETGLVSLRKLGFTLQAKSSGDATWVWLDNFRLSVPSLDGGGPSKMWREVAAP